MDSLTKQEIALQVIKILKSRFDSFPTPETRIRNAPFHNAFMQAFMNRLSSGLSVESLIGVSSWLHGLSTTLGQTFFERVAQILSGGSKKEFKNCEIYVLQNSAINELMTNYKNRTSTPSLKDENYILENNAHGPKEDAPNFVVDCFYETQNEIFAIELKSVKPNSGETRGEKQKVLKAKASLKILYPNKKTNYYFGFPFDPTSDTEVGSDKQRFMRSVIEFSNFCSSDDILIADEFWSMLSGEEKTMEMLLEIIRSISNSNFNDDFNHLVSCSILNNNKRYHDIVKNWGLIDELNFLKNMDRIRQATELTNRRTYSLIHSPIFNNDGDYNKFRNEKIKEILR